MPNNATLWDVWPDGRLPGDVYLVDPGSGRQQPWKNILPRDRAGIMAFISFQATPDGASHVYTWHRALSDLYVADGLA